MPRLAQEQGSDILAANHDLAVNPGWIDQPGSYIFRIGRVVIASLEIEEDESVAEWDEGVTYAKGEIARVGAINFISRVGGNVGNAPVDNETTAFWENSLLICTLPEAFWPEVDIEGGKVTATGEVRGEHAILNRTWLAARSSP